ncbi:hypothetical protein HY346_00405 [Candidatus Microgenomates bacterium]|nr:hypothetical protein [Candidatus Microgenomates bacterium]
MSDMSGYILLGIILGLPLLLGLAARVSAAHLFFSIMAGELLARYFGHQLSNWLGRLGENATATASGELLVMLLPLALTTIFLRNSLPRSKVVLHILPWAITGIILAAFALPVMPLTLQNLLQTTALGSYLLQTNGLIIGLVVICQLIALWILHRRGPKDRKSKID